MAVQDDYLACESYLGKELDATNPNITKFYDDKSKKYYFALLHDQNTVALKSEGYTTIKSRDNGLASVLKNMVNPKRFQVIKNKKVFNLVLKATNGQEIAVSCDFVNENEAQLSLAKLTNTEVPTENIKSTTKTAAPKKEVAPKAEVAKKPETIKKVVSAKTAPKAEAASKPAAKVEPKSVAEKSNAKIVNTKTKAAEKVNTTKENSTLVEKNDNLEITQLINLADYLSAQEYLEKERIWDSYGITGFVKFRHNNGKYYFGVYNPDASLYLRSKGFDDETSRDVAFDLMESSILLEENYRVEQIDGNYYAILFEYNEGLAISREFSSFIEAHLTTPGGRPKDNVVGTMY